MRQAGWTRIPVRLSALTAEDGPEAKLEARADAGDVGEAGGADSELQEIIDQLQSEAGRRETEGGGAEAGDMWMVGATMVVGEGGVHLVGRSSM